MSVKAILTEQQKSYTKAEEDALLATKQNTLTFDTTPTAGSTNPATSGGIATALDGRLPQPENAGAVGQVLTKTATGSVWQTQSSGGDIVAAASNSYAVTLYAASWSSQQQTIATPTGAEITSTSDGVLGLAAGATAAQVEAFQLAKIVVISQSTSGVVVKALGIVPTINLPCELMLFMKADYYNKDYIDTYIAPLDTPTFIGVPKAPTAAAGTNTTQIATTAFVEQAKNTRVSVYGMGKNLVRNWGFAHPVNQRSGSSYTSASSTAVYAIDGWRIAHGVATLSNGSINIKFNNSAGSDAILEQLITLEELPVGTYTFSILLANGTIIKGTNTLVESTGNRVFYNQNGIRLCVYRYATYYQLFLGVASTTGVDIVAVKLELGSEQTLCHNEGTIESPVWVLNDVPDYRYELYRCKTSTADSGDTYANKFLATEQEIAFIETGTTSARRYEIDDYFCFNGNLCHVTSAIPAGNPITPGTNCEYVRAATEILKGPSEMSGTSFTNFGLGYLGNGLQDLYTNIASKTSGVVSLSTGGPGYFAVLGKLNDSNFGGIAFTYASGAVVSFRVTGGTCYVRRIKG